jgi:hypothetical protein
MRIIFKINRMLVGKFNVPLTTFIYTHNKFSFEKITFACASYINVWKTILLPNIFLIATLAKVSSDLHVRLYSPRRIQAKSYLQHVL